MRTATWLTAIAAAYAAVVSTIVGLNQLSGDKKRVELTAKPDILPTCQKTDLLSIRVTNTGKRPLTILSIGFQDGAMRDEGSLPSATRLTVHGQRRLQRVPASEPNVHLLTDGATTTYSFALDDLLRMKSPPAFAVATDAEGGIHPVAISSSTATVRAAEKKLHLAPNCRG